MLLHTAPLAKYSTRYFLHLSRLITAQTTLWTEMVHASVVLHSTVPLTERYLPRGHLQGPNVVQLAASEPDQLRQSLVTLQQQQLLQSFQEINLNCGCPADSAESGGHGAFLLRQAERDRFRRLCAALVESAGGLRTSVKIRTGIQGESSFEALCQLVEVAQKEGIHHVVLHARDAIIGESCKLNRRIPPLKPTWARQLRHEFPALELTFNGEVASVYDAQRLLAADGFNGVMVGRLVMREPYVLVMADRLIYGDIRPSRSREEVALEYSAWLDKEEVEPRPSMAIAPLLNLFHGCRNGKRWKSLLTDCVSGSGWKVGDSIRKAIDTMNQQQ